MVAGNIAMAGDVSLAGVARYANGDELLADRNVDAVIVGLPTYLHKEYVLKAIQARKHILCEKPMALTAEEGRAILAALQGYDKTFMVAHCIRFWPAYEKAAALVREGTYGKVLSAHFERNSPKPRWAWEGWLLDERRSGGAILDLHIHDVDYVNDLFGAPAGIQAVGVREGDEGIGQVTALYSYSDGKRVTLDGGWSYPASFPFRMAFRIALEGATLEFNSLIDMNLHVHTASGEHLTPQLSEGDGYLHEQRYFFECVEKRRQPTAVTTESALQSLRLVEEEWAAIALGC
jgi:predicted dehydrogenase